MAIWTAELLAELHTQYVAAPDVSAKSFGDKLEIQLAKASDHARQLFAELYVLNLLHGYFRAVVPGSTWTRSPS